MSRTNGFCTRRPWNVLRTACAHPSSCCFPCTVQLAAGDYAVLEDIFPHIEGLGFDLKRFGKNTVVIEGVPPDVKAGHEQSILEEILALYKEYQRESPGEARDLVAKSFSCKSAIKAGDPLTEAGDAIAHRPAVRDEDAVRVPARAPDRPAHLHRRTRPAVRTPLRCCLESQYEEFVT